jgi:hypothetical protein
MASSNSVSDFNQAAGHLRLFDFTSVYRPKLGDLSLTELKGPIDKLVSKVNVAEGIAADVPETPLIQLTANVVGFLNVAQSMSMVDDQTFVAQRGGRQADLEPHRRNMAAFRNDVAGEKGISIRFFDHQRSIEKTHGRKTQRNN